MIPIQPWQSYALAFFVSIVSVFFKALQNRNYNFDNYILVIPTSWAIAGCELYLLSVLIRNGLDVYYVLAVGTGAGLGGIAAMWLHTRFIRKKP